MRQMGLVEEIPESGGMAFGSRYITRFQNASTAFFSGIFGGLCPAFALSGR